MKVNVGIWDKLSRIVVFLLFVAGLLMVAVWYLPLIKHNENARREILRLDTEYKRAEEASKALKLSIDALRYDSKAIERLARERLNYARPGEIVFRFEPGPTNSPGAGSFVR